jgi:hypothetical protein
VIIAAYGAPAASASEPLSDKNVKFISLAANAKGEAMVTYAVGTKVKHVLVWDAINAREPSPSIPQVHFKYDYAGGWGKYRKLYWKTFKNACKKYDGPALVMFTAGCKAPDGSYWAIQSWVRLQAMRGFAPFKPEHTAVELHLSHWSGALAELEIYRNWTYDGTLQGFFGRLMYNGMPVFGYRSPSAKVADPYGRNIYIDTFNSDYGEGWKRDTAINTHNPNGAFCYSFVPQKPPPGYPSDKPQGNGLGERHRITVMGPGVTPVLQWEGARLGKYDPDEDAKINKTFDEVMKGDLHCAAER